jgi:putative transcriptional regulator
MKTQILIKFWLILPLVLFANTPPGWSTVANPKMKVSQALSSQSLEKGVFLVASPSLQDPHFREAVVLICEYGAEGTVGLIINRPTVLALSEVFPDIPGLKGQAYSLFEGGPVHQRGILMLFRTDTPSDNTKLVFEGVYWGGNRDRVASMVNHPKLDERFRIFAGHAGWAPGQLEMESASGAWRIIPADKKSIFDTNPAKLWEELVEKQVDSRFFISYPPTQVP